MWTADLRALYASRRCNPDFLLAVWSELAFRERAMQVLNEPTIHVRESQTMECLPKGNKPAE